VADTAISKGLVVISFKAGADLSSSQFLGVKMDTTEGQVILMTGATDNFIGVLQNKPESGQEAAVAIAGVSKIEMGESSRPRGALMTCTASATFEQVDAAGEMCTGHLVATASSGEVGSMLITHYTAHASDA